MYFRLEGGEGEPPLQEDISGCEQFVGAGEPLATRLLAGLLPTLHTEGATVGRRVTHLTEVGADRTLHPTEGRDLTLLTIGGAGLILAHTLLTAGHQ